MRTIRSYNWSPVGYAIQDANGVIIAQIYPRKKRGKLASCDSAWPNGAPHRWIEVAVRPLARGGRA